MREVADTRQTRVVVGPEAMREMRTVEKFAHGRKNEKERIPEFPNAPFQDKDARWQELEARVSVPWGRNNTGQLVVAAGDGLVIRDVTNSGPAPL